MIVINKLTKPGGIRRVDLTPDTVCIKTSDGRDRVYRLVADPEKPDVELRTLANSLGAAMNVR